MLNYKIYISSGLLISSLLGCTNANEVKEAEVRNPLITEARAYWAKETQQNIQENTEACVDIRTKIIKEQYDVLTKQYLNEAERLKAYKLLLLKQQLEPTCASPYDHRTDLSMSDIVELKMQDYEKLPKVVKAKYDVYYEQALNEREQFQNLPVSAWDVSNGRIQSLLDCSNPVLEQIAESSVVSSFDTLMSQSEYGSPKFQKYIRESSDDLIDSMLVQSYHTAHPIQVFGFSENQIYKQKYGQFWGIKLKPNNDIQALVKKLGLQTQVDEVAKSRGKVIVDQLGENHSKNLNYSYYSKSVQDGFGEIQLKHILSDNPMYNASPKGSEEIWFLGCHPKSPLDQNKVNPIENERLGNNIQKAVNAVEKLFKN